MEIYLVGGAVRDKQMGVQPKDHDFVVVGGTAKAMLEKGFRQVGKDFPIFHDYNNDEFSLARRSRKDSIADFGFEVTLEEDLRKRDLTINAMAIRLENIGLFKVEPVFDFFGGLNDIKNEVLRHIEDEGFREDPIRVLRVARFAARYPRFHVAAETRILMKEMVKEGLLDSLTPERVWKELSRGLMERRPSRMLQVLRDCGALKVVFPEIDALYGVPQPPAHHPEIDTGVHIEMVLDYAADEQMELAVRFACLMHDLGKGITPADMLPHHYGHEGDGVPLVEAVCKRFKIPNEERDLAILTAREHGNIHAGMSVKPSTLARVLKRCDAFRKPSRFFQLLRAAECDARGRGVGIEFYHRPYPQAHRYRDALAAAMTVNLGEIAAKYQGRVEFIQDNIHAARVSAIKRAERAAKQ